MDKNRFFTAETIKAITIAILVPIAISAISYAQEQRGINDNLVSIKESLVHLQKNQVIENNKISTLYRQNTKLFQSQSSNSEKLNALSSSIKHTSREINRLEGIGEDANDWRKYRVELRNLPDQDGFPFDVDWPAQPREFTGK